MSWSDRHRATQKADVTPPAPAHNERYRTPGDFRFFAASSTSLRCRQVPAFIWAKGITVTTSVVVRRSAKQRASRSFDGWGCYCSEYAGTYEAGKVARFKRRGERRSSNPSAIPTRRDTDLITTRIARAESNKAESFNIPYSAISSQQSPFINGLVPPQGFEPRTNRL